MNVRKRAPFVDYGNNIRKQAFDAGWMRKEPNVPFGREAFVLEQHLDKLGANGWELIAVAGPPTDPAYYFKRRKQAETSR